MNELEQLKILEELFEPDPNEMELELMNMGYGRDFLESLTNNQLRHLYYDSI